MSVSAGLNPIGSFLLSTETVTSKTRGLHEHSEDALLIAEISHQCLIPLSTDLTDWYICPKEDVIIERVYEDLPIFHQCHLLSPSIPDAKSPTVTLLVSHMLLW